MARGWGFKVGVGLPLVVGIGLFLYNARQNAAALGRVEAACSDIDRLMGLPTAAGAQTFKPVLKSLCETVRGSLKPTIQLNYGKRLEFTPEADQIAALRSAFDKAQADCLAMMQREIGSKRFAEDVVADVLNQMIEKDGGAVPTSTARPDLDALAAKTCDAMLRKGRERIDKMAEPIELAVWDWPDEISIRADRISLAVQRAEVIVAFGRVVPEGAKVEVTERERGVRLKNVGVEGQVIDVVVAGARRATLDGHPVEGIPTDGKTCRQLLRQAGEACQESQTRVRIRVLAPGASATVETE